jgi:L-lactate dehydrogenase complex protein LldE
MGNLKLDHVRAAQPDVLVSSDMSCLMHITGLATKTGAPVKALHLAQVLRDALGRRDQPSPSSPPSGAAGGLTP